MKKATDLTVFFCEFSQSKRTDWMLHKSKQQRRFFLSLLGCLQSPLCSATIVVLRAGHTRRQVAATGKLAYIPVAAICHLHCSPSRPLLSKAIYCMYRCVQVNFIHVLKMMHRTSISHQFSLYCSFQMHLNSLNHSITTLHSFHTRHTYAGCFNVVLLNINFVFFF